MDKEKFWQIVSESRTGDDSGDPYDNMDDQIEKLTKLLSDLPPEEVVDFDRIFAELMIKAYTWDLWGAAYIIEEGCSDDGFMDFRGWLISMGREVYEKALADPESLAVLANDTTIEDFSFEEFQYVASEVHGKDIEDIEGIIEHPSEPAGTPFEEDSDYLKRRFPKLWNEFGDK